MSIDTEYLRPHEVKKRLGLSKNTLPRWRERKVGPPFVRLDNGHHLYPVAGLEQWLAERTYLSAEEGVAA